MKYPLYLVKFGSHLLENQQEIDNYILLINQENKRLENCVISTIFLVF